MPKPFLSKSKYLNGIQCPKLLWHHYNAKDKLPEVDKQTQAIFDQGHNVGELAKKLFPNGIDIEWELSYEEVIKQSQELLKEGKPLFEAGFLFNRTYARVDVLDPVGKGQYDIIEVKSGSSVKEINHHDVAFQRYCYQGAGVPIRRCHLMHIDTSYVKHGELDLEQLFAKEDITDSLDLYGNSVEDNVQEMLSVIASKKCPDCDIGPHCDDPYECGLKEICWAKVWKHDNSVFTLPYARGRQWELYGQGIIKNDQIPSDFPLTEKQRIQVETEKTGQPHIDKATIRSFLDQLAYPVYYMDFETFGFNMPIPMLDNTHPYGQVPFQFSVHVLQSPDSEPTHHSWLWDGEGDPRPKFLKQLKASLGEEGSIVVYNQGFECSRLRESSEVCPDYVNWVDEVVDRIVDLLPPFRSFGVYYPSQHGSASLKKVLPALTGKNHADLEISEGGEASDEFMRVTFGDVSKVEKEKVRKNLEEYCGLDTMGMVDIVEKLEWLLRGH
jgi:hypothetical protein